MLSHVDASWLDDRNTQKEMSRVGSNLSVKKPSLINAAYSAWAVAVALGTPWVTAAASATVVAAAAAAASAAVAAAVAALPVAMALPAVAGSR